MNSEIEALRRSARIPGCSIAMVDQSGVIWSHGFGFADMRRRSPATPATVYHLFSGTKLFTAMAVLQLEERGLLQLDDRVTKHLPNFPTLSEVRLVHLLSHRSGLKDTLPGFLAVYFPPDSPPSTSEALSAYRIVSARAPGRCVEYRNVNYALLGEVVTRVSGIEFSDYIRSNVLKPLGMHADFHLTEDMRPLAATGYIGMWDPMRVVLKLVVPSAARRLYKGRMGTLLELNEYGLSSAAIGGLVGSVLDFSRFLQSQLVGGGSVLSPGSMAKMQTMVAAGQAGVVSREGIGLGWKFGSGRHGRFMNHEGSGAGFASELRLYPDRGVGIALAMNAMRMPKTMRVAHAMCEALVQNFN